MFILCHPTFTLLQHQTPPPNIHIAPTSNTTTQHTCCSTSNTTTQHTRYSDIKHHHPTFMLLRHQTPPPTCRLLDIKQTPPLNIHIALPSQTPPPNIHAAPTNNRTHSVQFPDRCAEIMKVANTTQSYIGPHVHPCLSDLPQVCQSVRCRPAWELSVNWLNSARKQLEFKLKTNKKLASAKRNKRLETSDCLLYLGHRPTDEPQNTNYTYRRKERVNRNF